MNLNVNGLNNYDIYNQGASKIGANPFAGGQIGSPGSKGAEFKGASSARHLDSSMLAQKSENFKNGLGGAPTPPEGYGQKLWDVA